MSDYCRLNVWCALPRWHTGRCLTQVERDHKVTTGYEEMKAKLHDMQHARFNLWRGDCGHHWLIAEAETCPFCRLKEIHRIAEGDWQINAVVSMGRIARLARQ